MDFEIFDFVVRDLAGSPQRIAFFDDTMVRDGISGVRYSGFFGNGEIGPALFGADF